MRIDDKGNLTSETFDAIVRGEMNRQFYERYLTDQRIRKLYERVPEKELKEQAYSIFFRSFDDILEGIGIPRDKKMKLDYSCYDYSHHKIEWSEVVDAGMVDPGMEEDDSPQKDIESPFNAYMISFSYKRIKYKTSVTGRLIKIIEYVTTKGIYDPLFEAAKAVKYETFEERHVTRPDGLHVIKIDMYNYIRTIGTEVGRELKYLERTIWHPDIRPGDREREKMIGNFG